MVVVVVVISQRSNSTTDLVIFMSLVCLPGTGTQNSAIGKVSGGNSR